MTSTWWAFSFISPDGTWCGLPIAGRLCILGKPIHITEMGVNGGFRVKGNAGSSWSQLDMSEGTWHGGWNEHTQADWMEQFYTIAAARPEIKALSWWDFIEPSFSGNGRIPYMKTKIPGKCTSVIWHGKTAQSARANAGPGRHFPGEGGSVMQEMTNLFRHIGIADDEVESRIQSCFHQMFFDQTERLWHDVDADSACIVDTGNMDARTEGMSYGMMMCVQMDRQDLFDKLWQFSMRYMHQGAGKYQGYFAWSVALDGRHHCGKVLRLMEKNTLPWLYSWRMRAGAVAMVFSTNAAQAREILRQLPSSAGVGSPVAMPCGMRRTITSSLFLKRPIPILPIICPISMNCLPVLRISRTGLFGSRLPKPVASILCSRRIPLQG